MSFNFREDTPSDVLAAFSALAQPLPDDAWWGPAPELPQPVSEVHEWWSPDWREAGIEDEFEAGGGLRIPRVARAIYRDLSTGPPSACGLRPLRRPAAATPALGAGWKTRHG